MDVVYLQFPPCLLCTERNCFTLWRHIPCAFACHFCPHTHRGPGKLQNNRELLLLVFFTFLSKKKRKRKKAGALLWGQKGPMSSKLLCSAVTPLLRPTQVLTITWRARLLLSTLLFSLPFCFVLFCCYNGHMYFQTKKENQIERGKKKKDIGKNTTKEKKKRWKKGRRKENWRYMEENGERKKKALNKPKRGKKKACSCCKRHIVRPSQPRFSSSERVGSSIIIWWIQVGFLHSTQARDALIFLILFFFASCTAALIVGSGTCTCDIIKRREEKKEEGQKKRGHSWPVPRQTAKSVRSKTKDRCLSFLSLQLWYIRRSSTAWL